MGDNREREELGSSFLLKLMSVGQPMLRNIQENTSKGGGVEGWDGGRTRWKLGENLHSLQRSISLDGTLRGLQLFGMVHLAFFHSRSKSKSRSLLDWVSWRFLLCCCPAYHTGSEMGRWMGGRKAGREKIFQTSRGCMDSITNLLFSNHAGEMVKRHHEPSWWRNLTENPGAEEEELRKAEGKRQKPS